MGYILGLFTMLLLPRLALADYKAELFEEGSQQKTKLFVMENTNTAKPDGLAEIQSIFKDLQGQTAFVETATVKGTDFQNLSIEQKQSNEKASIQIKDGRILFSITRVDGKVETADEKLKGKVLIPLTFVGFVNENWDEFMAGKTIPFRFAVWHRKDTVGFEMFKIAEEGSGDTKLIVLKMKPSSFLIASLVKPLIFKFSIKDKKLTTYIGRVSPMKRVGSDLKDLDAEVVYQY